MKEIFEILLERCLKGKPTMLVTIVANTGSAPRGVGASMIVGKKGMLKGTIGGGNLEYQATKAAQENLSAEKGEFKEYHLTKENSANLGMVCGGNVDVLFTYISSETKTRTVLETATDHLRTHKPGWLILPFNGMEIGFFSKGKGLIGANTACTPGQKEFIDHTASVIETANDKCYVQRLNSTSRVYIFGGGHLAQELVPMLTHIGFRCIVTDDRSDFSTKELFPDAEEVHTLSYSNLSDQYLIQQQDYIVVITRGHLGDYEVLKYSLNTPAYYIGAVGSRSKIAEINSKLRNDGFVEEDIARVTTPIGIDIKSETPAEIAISIAAQLIEKRALFNLRNEGPIT